MFRCFYIDIYIYIYIYISSCFPKEMFIILLESIPDTSCIPLDFLKKLFLFVFTYFQCVDLRCSTLFSVSMAISIPGCYFCSSEFIFYFV